MCSRIFIFLAMTLASAAGEGVPFTRHYTEREELAYHMKATNKGRVRTETYEADAVGTVVRDADGNLVEEFGWENFIANGKPVMLPPQSVSFRQKLNLDPSRPPGMAIIAVRLVGPILDLLTFYSDVWLVYKNGLKAPGDHVHFPHGVPNSWAGGNVVLGEDSIDFDLSYVKTDASAKTATFLVRHVPPPKPQIKIPVDWMRTPVTDGPNNWVEVEKKDDKFVAAVGKETFDCEIKIDTDTGRILSATMENSIDVIERECMDEKLDLIHAGEPARYRIFRRIELTSRTHNLSP